MANPELRIEESGEQRTLQFKQDIDEGSEDRTVIHKIPFRDGDIEQKTGRGNRQISGTLVILPGYHPQGFDGYREFLREAARTDGYVTYIDEDGDEIQGAIREPNFNRDLFEYPSKEELRNFRFVELNQPQP